MSSKSIEPVGTERATGHQNNTMTQTAATNPQAPTPGGQRTPARVRRVVTGQTADGRSCILSDGDCPHTMALNGIPDFRLTELWKTSEMPVRIATSDDRCGVPIELVPFKNGTSLRFLEFPPDREWQGQADGAHAFAALGQSGASSIDSTSDRHEMMHATRTVDYIIILKGEIWAVMDEAETCLKAGDVLIQRGTNHAWSVRADTPCLMIAVLIDAQ